METKLSKTFTNFPSIPTDENFEDFVYEWTQFIDDALDKACGEAEMDSRTFLETNLNRNQRFLYIFYKLDGEICNGGFLQVILNLKTFLYYMLINPENKELLKQFSEWSTIIYNAHMRSKDLSLEVVGKFREFGREQFDRQQFYEKHESTFDQLEKMYFEKKQLFWNSFREFVTNNESDFFL